MPESHHTIAEIRFERGRRFRGRGKDVIIAGPPFSGASTVRGAASQPGTWYLTTHTHLSPHPFLIPPINSSCTALHRKSWSVGFKGSQRRVQETNVEPSIHFRLPAQQALKMTTLAFSIVPGLSTTCCCQSRRPYARQSAPSPWHQVARRSRSWKTSVTMRISSGASHNERSRGGLPSGRRRSRLRSVQHSANSSGASSSTCPTMPTTPRSTLPVHYENGSGNDQVRLRLCWRYRQ